ncbi:hypothetical protein ACOMHN_000029 [Nucella lapillus]
MRKILRRRVPLHQIIVVSIVGVLAGTYIWRPLIQQYVAEHPEVAPAAQQMSEGTATPASTDTDSKRSRQLQIYTQPLPMRGPSRLLQRVTMTLVGATSALTVYHLFGRSLLDKRAMTSFDFEKEARQVYLMRQ